MAMFEQYRAAVIAVAVVVLLGLGGVIGGGMAYWLTAGHYRPIVDKQQDAMSVAAQVLGSCRTTTSTMEGQISQQNLALADLRRAEGERAAKAVADQQQAAQAASEDYHAANRLQQERSGGDPAAAAAAVIDRELGL